MNAFGTLCDVRGMPMQMYPGMMPGGPMNVGGGMPMSNHGGNYQKGGSKGAAKAKANRAKAKGKARSDNPPADDPNPNCSPMLAECRKLGTKYKEPLRNVVANGLFPEFAMDQQGAKYLR